jgi:hypothetical protein
MNPPDEPASPPQFDPRYRQMKPNKMWPEEIRFLIRGYVAAQKELLPPCPVCGSKKRGRWTMLCPFVAYDIGGVNRFVVTPHEPELAPLTLICGEHGLWPTAAIHAALAPS